MLFKAHITVFNCINAVFDHFVNKGNSNTFLRKYFIVIRDTDLSLSILQKTKANILQAFWKSAVSPTAIVILVFCHCNMMEVLHLLFSSGHFVKEGLLYHLKDLKISNYNQKYITHHKSIPVQQIFIDCDYSVWWLFEITYSIFSWFSGHTTT